MQKILQTIISIFLIIFTLPSLANDHSIREKLAALEASSGGRLGVSAIHTTNNTHIQFRAEERFPFQSTMKVMVVADVLNQSMKNSHLLQEKIIYKKQDLVFWSPITEKHLAHGMTISELSAAAIMYSDNAATNLLIKKLGGLEAVTAYANSIGDYTFRLDNWEPDLNSNSRDVHDTTTPVAMEESLRKLALGNVLAPKQRELLLTWMKNNTTGDARIRAGVPKGWVVADKTGGGNDYGITNDIGIIWPPKCAPIVVVIFFAQDKKDAPRRDDVVASATRMLIQEFAKGDQCIKLGS